jgi:hypothetical protein
VDVTRNGAPDILRGAESCDLSGPADGFDLSCNWRFEAGEDDKAKRDFGSLRRQLEGCLSVRLKRREPPHIRPSRSRN